MMSEKPIAAIVLRRSEQYSYPKTAPIKNVGVKIPEGTFMVTVSTVKRSLRRIYMII